MNRSRLVSVIIPAYNHEKYIQATIESIINQTYQNIELIIINDGSTDQTWLKIQELKEQCDARFAQTIFLTQDNQGTCITLNRLIEESQGEYIYIIASDDLAKPHAIEKQVAFLNNNMRYALVVGDNEIIDANGVKCYWDTDQVNIYNINEAKFKTFGEYLQKAKGFNFKSNKFGNYLELLNGNFIPNGYLVRKDIFNIIGPFTKKAPLEDWWLMLQIAKYKDLKYIDEVLFSYRWHGANTIVKNRAKIKQYTEITRNHEFIIINSNLINSKNFSKKYGYCYKIKGFPFVLTVCKYSKLSQTTKTLRLFGIPIWESIMVKNITGPLNSPQIQLFKKHT